MPTYTRSDIKASVNSRIHNKIGILADSNLTINNAVREVISSLDMRSMKRKAATAPNLFDDIYQYACPVDLKGNKVISLQTQTGERNFFNNYTLTTEDEFDRRKEAVTSLLSFTDRDMTRRLLASVSVDDSGYTVSTLDTTSASGTWALFGDATGVEADTYQYVKGSGSISFDISAAGGTTAGIQSSNVSTFDLTSFKNSGSVFVWAYITSATNLTSYTIRMGSDSSNYYSITITSTNENASFVAGWNLLRFDFANKSTTGTPVDAACDYVALYMNKSVAKVSENDYRFDHIIVKLGVIHNLIYYSKYAWQTSAGVFIENSTADTDYINADTDEYSIIIEKCVEHAALEVREDQDANRASIKYVDLVNLYRKSHRSERIPLTNTYYNI